MIVVIDSNALLPALNPKHRYAVILDAWYSGRLVWALSTDILVEYHEVILRQSGATRWSQLERLLDLGEQYRGNVLKVAPSFHFHTVPSDRDDDKFADCAITAHADFIITDDSDFRELRGSGYKPQAIKPDEFIRRYLSLS